MFIVSYMYTAYSTSVNTDGAELVFRVAPRASMRAYRTLGELFSTAARGGSMREDRVHLVNSFQGGEGKRLAGD